MSSLADRDGRIWFDGELVDWREAKIHVLAHALHYGTGVFEGVRAYEVEGRAAIFRLPEHVRRLFDSAKILGMKIPFSPEAVERAHCDTLRDNNLSSAYIRPLAFYGAGALGISAKNNPVHLVIAAWPWGSYLGEEALQNGICVKTSSFARHHVNVTMCRAKTCGNYVNSVLAHQEVAADGYEEGLLLDVDGFVAEGTGENIFIVKNGALYTPELTSALEGITRATVLELAAEEGLEVREKRIPRDELYCADEAFFTGTAAEVTPIREVDGRVIGEGGRGAVTEKLQSAYFDCVRGNRRPQWQTRVE